MLKADAESIRLEEEKRLDASINELREEFVISERLEAELKERKARMLGNVRVNDVIFRKFRNGARVHSIEAEFEAVKNATTRLQIRDATEIVLNKLRDRDKKWLYSLGVIVRCEDATGPPGTVNVIIELEENFLPPDHRGPVSYILLPYGSGSGSGSGSDSDSAAEVNPFVGVGVYSPAEVSAGVSLVRILDRLSTSRARLYLLSQERSLGLSLGLFSNHRHDLACNLAWRTLRGRGHDLLSSLTYTYKFDKRNSLLRPTRGYAFFSTSEIGTRFLRQEFDLRFAVPVGFRGNTAALNFGISSGVVLPIGRGQQFLPNRLSFDGNLFPIPSPSLVAAPAESGRQAFVSASADLSFNLPARWFRDNGIYGHLFASAGNNIAKLTDRNFSLPKILDSFRTTCVGAGIVYSTNLFRLEVNYCHMLSKFSHGKSGFQISLSPHT